MCSNRNRLPAPNGDSVPIQLSRHEGARRPRAQRLSADLRAGEIHSRSARTAAEREWWPGTLKRLRWCSRRDKVRPISQLAKPLAQRDFDHVSARKACESVIVRRGILQARAQPETSLVWSSSLNCKQRSYFCDYASRSSTQRFRTRTRRCWTMSWPSSGRPFEPSACRVGSDTRLTMPSPHPLYRSAPANARLGKPFPQIFYRLASFDFIRL